MKPLSTITFYLLFVGIFLQTYVCQGQTTCSPIYVSTTGTATALGTISMPTTLEKAISRVQMTGGIIKIAIGNYLIDSTLRIPSHVVLEGGFDPANNWTKTSLAGATVIHRTALNPAGIYNTNQHLTALEMNACEHVRLQDLTITTAAGAVGSGISTYGIFIDNASDYHITRVQVLPGNAGSGIGEAPSCGRTGVLGSSPLDGGNGANGENGEIDDNNANIKGGNGGAGGIACNGTTAALGGLGGRANNGNVGQDGNSAVASSMDGGAGAGGGQGGPEANGFSGGTSGAGGAPTVPPSGCAATPTGLGPIVIGGIGGLLDDPGTAGTDGLNGIDGNVGCLGSQGSGGSIQNCRFYVGGQGGLGTDGSAGSGGSGGGGGGGQNCSFCIDGTGNAGGGGGGGGAGGEAGIGSFGGGASFGIFICNNGNNAWIEDCFVEAGAIGAGGNGGLGGVGGFGGQGGLGGSTGLSEIGRGGNGGAGGNGGDGGQGGNGSDGLAVNIYWSGTGTSPIELDSTFDLVGQSVIHVSNVETIGQSVEFTDVSLPIGTGLTNWDFDLTSNSANPAIASDNPSTAVYTAPGRYSIRHNTIGAALSEYKGFFGIPVAFTITTTTTASSSATVGNGTATVSPQVGGTYTYQWDASAGNQSLPTVTGLLPGTYCVTITDGNGCLNVACARVLLNTATQSINNQAQNVRIYPNPTNHSCVLLSKEVLGTKELSIVNTLGQLKYQAVFEGTEYSINVQKWENGVYWVELNSERGKRWIRKLVVQH
jgi:hypothetical protein